MIFKTEPYNHQLAEWQIHRDDKYRALFWEQGTGKTKETLDQAQWLYRQGKIDAMLVLAPNGVHRNWRSDEIPAHWPDELPMWSMIWKTGSAGTKWHGKAASSLLEADFPFLAMSYDGFMTKRGRDFAMEFLKKRKVFYVLDESARIKSPSAKRTRAVVSSGKYAEYKRILTGTPVANGPFDIYSQLKFLDEDFWKTHGFASYEAFKTWFGIWEQRVVGSTGRFVDPDSPEGKAAPRNKRFAQVVAYRNLDQLHDVVQEVSSRVLKCEVLDLPPKIYEKRYHEMGPKQAAVYEDLKTKMMCWLEDPRDADGAPELITTELVIVRLMRLQQVLSGFLPRSDGSALEIEPGCNSRLACLGELVEDIPGKVIIWARFVHDVNLICTLLGEDAVRYDGQVSDEDRARAVDSFQNYPETKYFVANPAAGGEGLTLHAASNVIYYSNSFNLTHRLQSEDRAHRIGQTKAVTYFDLVAEGTVDDHIVKKLRLKLDMASKITGDEVKTWL